MLSRAIHTILTTDTAIGILIQDSPGNYRAYPVEAVQSSAFPLITWQKIPPTEREVAHSGPIKAAKYTYQISCWGKKPIDSETLAKLVVKKFNCLKGEYESEVILLCKIENEVDLTDPETQTYQVAIDVSILVRE